MKRTPLAALSVACIAALGAVGTGCGGGDDGNVVDQATSEVGKAVDTVTSEVGKAVDTVTSEVGKAVDTATTELGGGQTIEIPADSTRLAFSRASATAESGAVTLKMPNPSAIPHNIALRAPDKKGEVVTQGGVSEVSADLPAGTYTYYCSVPGHLEAGMKGTLTVK